MLIKQLQMQNWKVIHSRLQPYAMIYIYICVCVCVNFKLVGSNAVVGVLGNERAERFLKWFLSTTWMQVGVK